jgi:serine/threonine protein kinase
MSGHQRLIAVKAMLPELASRADFRSMFLEEGQLVRSIEHPNVVRVYEVSEDRGILYMAMEWVEGDSLRAVIREAKRRRAIPPEMAVRMIADTAAGLHAAHELRDWNGELRGIVHCDVSPHNILIGLDGQAKLVDFGVASAAAHSDEDRIKGKYGYMSPEQVEALPFDRRSDLFSLGIVLFELTTGERLFKGRDPNETLNMIVSGKIPRPTEMYAKYPPRLERIVLRALAHDPAERFQTAEQFREALDRYLIEERILVSRASVAQLLKRVLGARLAQQRDSIHAALQAIDGRVAAGIIPNESLVPSTQLTASGEMSFSPRSSSGAQSSWATADVPTSSEPPTSTHSQLSGTTRPQTVAARRPHRSSRLFMFGVLTAIAAAAAAVVWKIDQHRLHPTAAAGGAVIEIDDNGNPLPAVSDDSLGVSFDSLPAAGEQADTNMAPAATPPAGQRRTPRAAEPAAEKTKSLAEMKLEEAAPEPAPSAAPPPPAPEISQPPPPPKTNLPPLDQRPPLNQGAAIAAVGTAASSASSCKQPDGPSGGGRAAVTFSPDGHVTAVTLSAPFAGTSVGNCVTGTFRRAKIPPFRGSPVTLNRSFTIPN